jgi:hypothetical protein
MARQENAVNDALRHDLLNMAAEDRRVRAELLADGSLGEGYHPRMEEVHRRNAAALTAIIQGHGWPGHSLVGEDGAKAAWLVLQHAIGEPALQRRGLVLLREGVAAGEVPAWQAAFLEDRIRFFEGRPQVYGTQYDWDETGELSPHPVEDPAGVDERRHAVGLGPLGENTRRMRVDTAGSREGPPADRAGHRREFLAWCRQVGWRE